MKKSPDPDLLYTLALVMTRYPDLIRTIKRKYATDDIWQYCIDQKPELFQYCEDPSYTLCRHAVQADGHNIKYVPSKFIGKECVMVEWAIRRSPDVVFELPPNLRTEHNFEIAFDADPTLMKHVDHYDDDYLKDHIEKYPSHIQYINNPPEWLKVLAIRQDPNAALMIPKEQWTSFMKSEMKSRYPEYYQSMSF